MKEIASALVKAQKAFGPALKTATNPHFRSRYADLSACVEAVIGALNDNGIFLMQKCYDCENGVTIETIFIHESGETLDCGILTVPATKHDAQGYGSALTYARRYSLMAACGIAPEDDDGNAAVRKEPKELPVKSHVEPEKLGLLIDKMREAENEEQLKASYRIAYQACHSEKQWQDLVAKVKDELRALLNG
jgi:hypothetical protein